MHAIAVSGIDLSAEHAVENGTPMTALQAAVVRDSDWICGRASTLLSFHFSKTARLLHSNICWPTAYPRTTASQTD